MTDSTYKGVPKTVLQQAHKLNTQKGIPIENFLLVIASEAQLRNLAELKAWVLENPRNGAMLRDAISYYVSGGLPDGASDKEFDE